MLRVLFASVAVVLAASGPTPTGAQPADPKAAGEAAVTDSLEAALQQFEDAEPPSAADSAALRRWADSVRLEGRRLLNRRPTRARARFQQTLSALRPLADSAGVAETFKDIGVTYYFQSRFEDALDQYRNAIRIAQAHGGAPETITSSRGNIGLIYWNQGQYEKALLQYRKALDVDREIGNRAGIAASLNNIGMIRGQQGRAEDALVRFQEALEIQRDLGNRDDVGPILNNIGGVLEQQGKYEEAVARYQDALQVERAVGDRRGIAANLSNLGAVYERQGRYDEALTHFRAALGIEREIGDRQGIAVNLGHVGDAHLKDGRLPAATDTLSRAVQLAEELRLNATSPRARRSLLSTQIEAYRALTTAHVRSGHPDAALRSLERARARLLADRLAGTATGDTSFTVPSAADLRRTLGPDGAALLYANVGTDRPLTALAVTRDTTVARVLPDSTLRAKIAETYPSRLNRLRREEGPLAAALGTGGAPTERPSLAEVIRLYRHDLVRPSGNPSRRSDLARRLRGLLVEPVADVLGAKNAVTVVPSGALGYLPVETLRDSTGRYLIENMHVRYAQSLTVLRQLQARDYPPRGRPLLAMGGAAYQQQAGPTGGVLAEAQRGSSRVQTRGHAAALLRDAERQLTQGRSPRATYERLGYGAWPPLPATEGEARRVGQVAGPEATVVTGPAASEAMVRSMSADGRLRQYRRVHFATHGIAVPETPALSALVLSQVGASDSLAARDGYLTMEEIADLKMKADVAVLSACQTGLGKVVAGEGVVSLSHAFLRAGANATLVSQWKVLDESTRRFMAAVYRRAEKRTTSFAEAVTETKRAFIAGAHGEKNTDPLRWAPFVYYGRE